MSIKRLWHPTGIIDGEITLDGSKSISNRVLIIRALSKTSFVIHHLSTSDDTKRMEALLGDHGEEEYNVGHAGTTYRFLTAYLAIQPGSQVLTGSSRMLERPIGPLVDALRAIGCNIEYIGKEGYPPLRIGEVDPTSYHDEVKINSGISSQYITALILVAPALPRGLRIVLEGDMVSESYLQLTFGIVRDFGIQLEYDGSAIQIPAQEYQPREYTIEADWSAASYHYSLVALAKKGQIKLKGLFQESLQGDRALVEIGKKVGVASHWDGERWILSKKNPDKSLKYNFINQPDVAQTMGVICAAANIENEFSGLKTLRIKETDRITAMNAELNKIGSNFLRVRKDEQGEEYYHVSGHVQINGVPRFDTYKDHRMAMAFAPLGLIAPIEINKPMVVTKSYPAFYEDLEKLGFVIEDTE